MRLLILAGALLAGAGLFGGMSAEAAPDNKKTFTFDVSCDAPLDDITTVSGNGGGAVFTEDGQVLLAKRISGTTAITISIQGGPTISFDEPFEAGAKGKGFEGNLVSCDFTQQFEDQFTLSKKDVADFQLGNSSSVPPQR